MVPGPVPVASMTRAKAPSLATLLLSLIALFATAVLVAGCDADRGTPPAAGADSPEAAARALREAARVRDFHAMAQLVAPEMRLGYARRLLAALQQRAPDHERIAMLAELVSTEPTPALHRSLAHMRSLRGRIDRGAEALAAHTTIGGRAPALVSLVAELTATWDGLLSSDRLGLEHTWDERFGGTMSAARVDGDTATVAFGERTVTLVRLGRRWYVLPATA